MKRYISSMLIVFMFLTTTFGSMSVFADTEIDETAPVIHSIKVLNGENFDANHDQLQVEIQLTEEGSGLNELSVHFEGMEFRWETFYVDGEDCNEDPILFTGTHVINLNRQESQPIGTYELTFIAAHDINDNIFELFGDEVKDYYGKVPKINVTKSSYKEERMELKSFRFLKTENIDGRKSVEAEISFDGNVDLHRISLDFYDVETGEETWAQIATILGEDNALKPGTHRIKFALEDKLWKGRMGLYGVTLNWKHYFMIEEGQDGFEDTILHITKGRNPVIDPVIKDFTVKNPKFTAPEVLKLNLDIEDNGNELNYISISYTIESGKIVSVEGDLKKTNGKYVATIPFGPFLGEGKMKMKSIRVDYAINNGWDGYKGYDTYISRADNPELIEKGDINVDSGYNIIYFGSLGNSKVQSILKGMKAGETAVLDCRNYKTASKAVFEAIAGRDITVAFVDNNVQWVFNGKDIKKSKCKKINLKSTIKVVSGSVAGFPDDTKVAKLIFQNNGELPGEVEMRINYEYLAAKYKFKKENLKLTYLDANQNAIIEDSNVDMAKDQYYEYEVDHNSTFVLSKNKAKIGKTTVTAVPNGLKSVKIKWKKTAGNGYYIYRATKKDGKYKKVATIKKNTILTYVDKNVKKGKNYYYKVKPYSKKTTFNKTAKMSKPCKVYTRLKAPNIDTCRKVKNKLRIRVEWYGVKDAKYYEVYRSTTKNGTYKKVYTEKKSDTNYYIDKKIKKGKTYYYKIKAIYKKNSKYNSKLGAYRNVTIK